MSESTGKPTFLEALALVALYIGFQSGIATLAMVPSIVAHGEPQIDTTLIAVANALAILPTIWLGTLICKTPWRPLVAFGPPQLRLAPAVVLMGLGAFVLCSDVENLTRHLLPMPKRVADLFERLFDVEGNPWGAAMALVIVAPLTEELLCRRWVLGGLLPHWRPWPAITLSGLIFGLMHMNPWQFFYAVLLGMSIGWIYWRTRSVWLCVLAHALNNGLAWFFSFFKPQIPGLTGAHGEAVVFQPWWLDGSALVVFFIGVWWLRRQTPTPSPEPPALLPPELPPVVPPEVPPVLPPGA